MKIFQIIFILMAVMALALTAAVKRRDLTTDFDGVESFEDDGDDDDKIESENAEPEELPIASIKSRAIAMDRELCRELSRYHPHQPRCHLYCVQLRHWMGMCRRDSCHCYS